MSLEEARKRLEFNRRMEAQERGELPSSLAPVAGSAPLTPEDDGMVRDMACFLWECSRLRHGLFTPPEFIPLVTARLRDYIAARNRLRGYTRKPNDQAE